jgi:hypothetical protein
VAVTDRRLWQLEGDLRQAFENYCGGTVSGPWDDLIDDLAKMVHCGQLDLEQATRLGQHLARTQGGTSPERCEVCRCPAAGMVHP